MPLCRNLASRLGLAGRPGARCKLHRTFNPRAVGVPILLACPGAADLAMLVPHQQARLLSIALLVGQLDDILGPRPSPKSLGQSVACSLALWAGDSGSLSLAFLLGCYGVIRSRKSTTVLGMTAPLMELSIPLRKWQRAAGASRPLGAPCSCSAS